MASIEVNWTETVTYTAIVEVELTGAADEYAIDLITEEQLADAITAGAVIHDSSIEIHSAEEEGN